MTALLGAQLKPPQQLFVDIIADGPLGTSRRTSTHDGRVRGYVGNPQSTCRPLQLANSTSAARSGEAICT